MIVEAYEGSHFELPPSADSLIAFLNKSSSEWSKHGCGFDIGSVLILLREHKDELLFLIVNDDILSDKLIVVLRNDTLLCKKGSFQFPCIDYVIEGYIHSYCEPPNSVDDLIIYDSIYNEVYDEERDFIRCRNTGLRKLKRNLNSIIWLTDEDQILLKCNNDTISIHNVLNCYYPDEQMFMFKPRFFDKNGYIILEDDDLRQEFRKSLIQQYYNTFDAQNSNKWHYFMYTMANGLSSKLNYSYMVADSESCKALEEVVSKFCIEHGITKIIFTAQTLCTPSNESRN